jgi:hypothetical protein
MTRSRSLRIWQAIGNWVNEAEPPPTSYDMPALLFARILVVMFGLTAVFVAIGLTTAVFSPLWFDVAVAAFLWWAFPWPIIVYAFRKQDEDDGFISWEETVERSRRDR